MVSEMGRMLQRVIGTRDEEETHAHQGFSDEPRGNAGEDRHIGDSSRQHVTAMAQHGLDQRASH
jgi:hypothetical protein